MQKKKMIFVINGAAQRARITEYVAISLSQYGTVAPVTTFQRTDFASAIIDGRTVQEIDGKAAPLFIDDATSKLMQLRFVAQREHRLVLRTAARLSRRLWLPCRADQ